MTRGRKPLGDKAMTPAERAARYRAAHQERRASDTGSRPTGAARGNGGVTP